ncbi:hypothetical protein, partial [Martelella alba]|uniref:hypothetical protein n=1 Tax=Martelella alba TaxID=2590451 RepID=UPI001AED86B8
KRAVIWQRGPSMSLNIFDKLRFIDSYQRHHIYLRFAARQPKARVSVRVFSPASFLFALRHLPTQSMGFFSRLFLSLRSFSPGAERPLAQR